MVSLISSTRGGRTLPHSVRSVVKLVAGTVKLKRLSITRSTARDAILFLLLYTPATGHVHEIRPLAYDDLYHAESFFFF